MSCLLNPAWLLFSPLLGTLAEAARPLSNRREVAGIQKLLADQLTADTYDIHARFEEICCIV